MWKEAESHSFYVTTLFRYVRRIMMDFDYEDTITPARYQDVNDVED